MIEHNLDVIKTADWIIDLGPEGGAGGGRIVAEGPLDVICGTAASHTGEHLVKLLGREQAAADQPSPGRRTSARTAQAAPRPAAAGAGRSRSRTR